MVVNPAEVRIPGEVKEKRGPSPQRPSMDLFSGGTQRQPCCVCFKFCSDSEEQSRLRSTDLSHLF